MLTDTGLMEERQFSSGVESLNQVILYDYDFWQIHKGTFDKKHICKDPIIVPLLKKILAMSDHTVLYFHLWLFESAVWHKFVTLQIQ